MTAAETQTEKQSPLWPNGMKINFIGVTGEYQSGKTLFGLMIDPGERTIHLDTEDSAEPYEGGLNFTRIDIPAVMAEKYPQGNYTPLHLFVWFWDFVRSIKPGQYSVLVIDTISEIESGLVTYVRQNPGKFGYTAAQFQTAAGLMWGAAKDLWKQILSDINTRVQTVVAIAHMRDEFAGGKPTGKREAKGKETIMELASLYLELRRRPDEKGRMPEKPAGIVKKSRLAVFVPNKSGELEAHPLLPPRIPICTPAMIRKYIESPPDYSKLKADERYIEDQMGEDQKLLLELAIEENRRATAEMKVEYQRRAMEASTVQVAVLPSSVNPDQSGAMANRREEKAAESAKEAIAAEPAPAVAETPAAPPAVTPAVQTTTPDPNATLDQPTLDKIAAAKKEIGYSADQWKRILTTSFKVNSARELTQQSAELLLTKMEQKIAAKKKSGELKEWSEQQVPDSAIAGSQATTENPDAEAPFE